MGQLTREDVNTRRADAVQRESDHDRWANDGGFIPELPVAQPEVRSLPLIRNPWMAIAVVVALGFAAGRLTRWR